MTCPNCEKKAVGKAAMYDLGWVSPIVVTCEFCDVPLGMFTAPIPRGIYSATLQNQKQAYDLLRLICEKLNIRLTATSYVTNDASAVGRY